MLHTIVSQSAQCYKTFWPNAATFVEKSCQYFPLKIPQVIKPFWSKHIHGHTHTHTHAHTHIDTFYLYKKFFPTKRAKFKIQNSISFLVLNGYNNENTNLTSK